MTIGFSQLKDKIKGKKCEGSEEEKHFSRPFDFLTSVLPLWQHKAIAFMAIALRSKTLKCHSLCSWEFSCFRRIRGRIAEIQLYQGFKKFLCCISYATYMLRQLCNIRMTRCCVKCNKMLYLMQRDVA